MLWITGDYLQEVFNIYFILCMMWKFNYMQGAIIRVLTYQRYNANITVWYTSLFSATYHLTQVRGTLIICVLFAGII
jgi:hypothetical protein